jgi:hypothetical protein
MENSIAIGRLERAVVDVVAVCTQADSSYNYFCTLSEGIERLVALILETEATLPREHIVRTLAPLRAIAAHSPFLGQLRSRLRGGHGDLDLFGQLLVQHNRSALGTAQYWLEQYVLEAMMTQRLRQQIQTQAMEILAQAALARDGGSRRRILLFANGASADMFRIKAILNQALVEIVVHDIDADAEALARSTLEPDVKKPSTLRAILRQRLRQLARQGPFDLILAGHLLDHLNDGHAAQLIRLSFSRLLAEQGTLIFTSVSSDHPVRPWLEYVIGWAMYFRTEQSMDALLARHGMAHYAVTHRRHGDGHTIITRVAAPVSPLTCMTAAGPAASAA